MWTKFKETCREHLRFGRHGFTLDLCANTQVKPSHFFFSGALSSNNNYEQNFMNQFKDYLFLK